ncbi:hypothetical protein QYE76_038197 [Lolium multiflorum]|uniref:Uncharacterized protein n=1 Tax=Lolium multiflorum TaxID=4521 RepID=A0AAD8T7G3_LOLMU|nr:hypothetical protein QYE76_038197 [Lolium multiflorum]
MKAKHGWTDTSVDDILEYMKDLLPAGNTCPGSLAEAKRITCPLDLPHEKYHACINDCIMYRKEHMDKTKCPVCEAERYKKGKKKAPRKVVWYFPLAPGFNGSTRTARKQSSCWHAERKEAVLNDEDRIEHPVLTHPSDASQWKALDNEFGSFGEDPRNIRLGASTDGFNPFGNQSSTHSTWPVFVWIYNLPPWLCMKRKYIQMSMLIQGPTQPGNDINMYLELLKEELETLWAEEGVDTWDAAAEEYFPLRAVLITTVQDYLGYGYISCQVCHGHKACVRCMEETMFLQLGKDPGSSKTVYMGHRRWLQKTDPWRKRGDLFDGTNEPRGPPRKKSGEEIDTLLKGWKECPAPGKIRQKPGEKKKKKETTPLIGVWKRRSVFWDLPYWKILDTPHCLDVMHITKNVCESLLGTLLNMPDRTKDGPKARHDLKVLGIREELQIPPAQEGQSEEEADGATGGTFMSITLGEATKLLDNMMINYSEWHTERAPQGKKVNSVEETSSLSDKIDAIMSMLVNDRTNIDPNNVPLASLVAQEEHVDVNFIKNNNFNNNAYRNNSSNNYRPYPYNNGNGYGNSYGNSYNNNRSSPPGLEAMLKEFISTQTAFNKTVEEKLGKIDILASKVDSLAADVDLLKSKVMPNENHHNKIVTTANAIQVRINENIRLMAELRARWDREENEKLAKEKNVAKVWTITTTSNANATHVAAPPTNTNKRIGVSNVSTSNAKREKLPETAETACDKAAEIFSNIGDDDPIALDYNGLNFDDCHISEVIKFLQKLAKSPNASAINLAFTHHITNALIKAREEKLEREASIPKKLEDGWEPIIKMKIKDFDCNALCDLGASISVMPKKIYNMLDLPHLKNCYLDVNLADHSTKKPLGKQAGEIDNLTVSLGQSSLVVQVPRWRRIPGVAPHYIPPPSTFNVLLDSYWFDKPWFLTEGNLLLHAHPRHHISLPLDRAPPLEKHPPPSTPEPPRRRRPLCTLEPPRHAAAEAHPHALPAPHRGGGGRRTSRRRRPPHIEEEEEEEEERPPSSPPSSLPSPSVRFPPPSPLPSSLPSPLPSTFPLPARVPASD